MNKIIKTFIYTTFLTIIIFAAENIIRGLIVGISDGDTVTLLTLEKKQLKIRLQGVDCPEKNQAFGSKAKQFTSELVFNKQVSVKVYDTDRYGRTVGGVILPDGRSLNRELIRAGYAWHYKQYSSDPELADLENEARTAKRGLWADPAPIPPWDFRRGNLKTIEPAIDNKAQPATSGTVFFNTSTLKYHCLSCPAARKCTRNCIEIPASEVGKRGGVPCKICGGCK